MISPALPSNESERLNSLAEHSLLDTMPEDVYDDITRLAAEICGTPIAAINLVAGDRQWSKSALGFAGGSVPRTESFCAHAILHPNTPMIVEDARYDERFFDNPMTIKDPGIIFYAGVPVQDAEGRALGSLCVCDNRPRELPEYKMDSLKALAKLVNTHFQLRRTNLLLEKKQQQLQAAQPLLQTLQQSVSGLEATLQEPANTHVTTLHQAVQELQNVLSPSEK